MGNGQTYEDKGITNERFSDMLREISKYPNWPSTAENYENRSLELGVRKIMNGFWIGKFSLRKRTLSLEKMADIFRSLKLAPSAEEAGDLVKKIRSVQVKNPNSPFTGIGIKHLPNGYYEVSYLSRFE